MLTRINFPPRMVQMFWCAPVLAWLLSATRLAAAAGDEHWDVQFGWPGTTNTVYALAVENGQVYASGFFSTPAISSTNFIEVWNGTRWSYIPGIEGSTAAIYDIAFMGGELYAAGTFSRAGTNRAVGLARWNGVSWSDVGGFEGAVLTAISDGSTLYVGGIFTNAGGVHVTNVACWNGSQWSALGGGLGVYNGLAAKVDVLHLHQGVLHAGGTFTNSGNVQVRNFARWDGNQWVEVGGGTDAPVYALASDGGQLYAGGNFTSAGGVPANRIARWNGASWAALGSGANNTVSAIGVLDGRVYISGGFTSVGGASALRFAVWNGSAWSAIGTGLNGSPNRIRVAGTNLYVGGEFTQADELLVNHVAVWNGTDWTALGQSGRANGVAGVVTAVRAIASSGNDVYVGGLFTGVGRIRANRIARFDGTNWHPLGSGLRGTNASFSSGTAVNAIAVDGPIVYAGGIFTNAGGVAAANIARWNGSAWSALGAGVPGSVSAIAVRGGDVFVGGTFTMNTADGLAFNIARWDGVNWWSLPGAFAGTINNFFVNAIAIQGNNVIVGGSFFAANFNPGSSSTNIALHDGTQWLPLGNGVNSNVNAIAILGGQVYAAGRFSSASGVAASRIARWDGASWFPVGAGILGSGNFSVSDLAVIGTHLHASGNFTNAGGVTVNRVARWDGSQWSALGTGLTRVSGNVTINKLGTRANDLFAGGSIEYAGGKPSLLFARWNDQIDFDAVPGIQLGNLLASSTGPFKMEITTLGVPSYIIEASTNLASWIPLLTNSASPYEFWDLTAPTRPHRFYRARPGP